MRRWSRSMLPSKPVPFRLGQGPSIAVERAFYFQSGQRKLDGRGTGWEAPVRFAALAEPLGQEPGRAEVVLDRVREGCGRHGPGCCREELQGLAERRLG